MNAAQNVDLLRQSFPLATHAGMKAFVGWNHAVGTYWFAIVRVRPGWNGAEETDFDDVFYARGDETDRITNVADLVRATWGEIYWWDEPPRILHLLRDEPAQQAMIEAAVSETYFPLDVENYICNTFDTDVPELRSKKEPTDGPKEPDSGEKRSFFGRR